MKLQSSLLLLSHESSSTIIDHIFDRVDVFVPVITVGELDVSSIALTSTLPVITFGEVVD